MGKLKRTLLQLVFGEYNSIVIIYLPKIHEVSPVSLWKVAFWMDGNLSFGWPMDNCAVDLLKAPTLKTVTLSYNSLSL